MQDDLGERQRDPAVGADQIEADWSRSLDAATDAVAASRRARVLEPRELAAESQHISEERRWLSGFKGTLRRLFPRRRQRGAA